MNVRISLQTQKMESIFTFETSVKEKSLSEIEIQLTNNNDGWYATDEGVYRVDDIISVVKILE